MFTRGHVFWLIVLPKIPIHYKTLLCTICRFFLCALFTTRSSLSFYVLTHHRIIMPHYRGNSIPGMRSTVRVRRRRRAKTKETTAQRAKRNTRAIAKLARAVTTYRQYQNQNQGTIASETHVDLITQPQVWTSVFQSNATPAADVPRQYNLNNVHCNLLVQTEDEGTGNVHFQLFIVGLRKKFAMQTRERTGNLGSLSVGEDYLRIAAGTVGGVVQGFCGFYLNPALYRTHWTSGPQRIGQTTMGGTSGNVTNIRDSTYQKRVTLPFKRTFKAVDHRDDGYKSLETAELKDENMLYMIMLSNSGETSETFIAFNYFLNGTEVAN